jgi:hypothetical protein
MKYTTLMAARRRMRRLMTSSKISHKNKDTASSRVFVPRRGHVDYGIKQLQQLKQACCYVSPGYLFCISCSKLTLDFFSYFGPDSVEG